MPQVMKKDGATREVMDCFVREYTRMGWEVVPMMIDDKPNPEFMAAFPHALRAQKGRGPEFSGAKGGAAKPAEPASAPPAAPAAEPETAAQRHARKNGAAPAAEPGKE